jgi:hypothetical protein
VLQEAVELVEVAEGDGQEGRGVGVVGAGDRAQLELQLVAEALDAPAIRTRSPCSKRPASRSASRKTRAGMAPVRSRSSSARYGVPVRAVRRSLRVQANTPLTSSPGRIVATAAAVSERRGALQKARTHDVP